MNMATKKDIFERYVREYLQANRKRKGEILDHACDAVQVHRKSAVRRFRRLRLKQACDTKKRGRKMYYTPNTTAALRALWDMTNEICAERLHSMVNEYITKLMEYNHWNHGDEATAKLRAMSLGTMKKRIKKFTSERIHTHGISTTKPSQLKMLIPIRTGPWENPLPGNGEIDTVEHCGGRAAGDYAFTVNYVDIATFWEIRRAQIGKGQQRTLDNIIVIRERLPWELLGLDPDSGGEFINWVCYEWCKENKVELTRSRPYRKNDNAHVEQKNYTGVRNFIGYVRIDCIEAVNVMNELYEVLDLYTNFFIPSMKLLKKERIGSRYRRIYEKGAKTPYQRALVHPKVSQTVKRTLRVEYESLDPLKLKEKVDTLYQKVMKTQERYGFTNSS